MRVMAGPPATWDHIGPTAVAVGVFDGVHRGHRAILDAAVAAASSSGLVPAVLTFDPNPRSVIDPASAPRRLTTLEQRLELFAEAGAELTAVLPFDHEVRGWDAATFSATILREALTAAVVVVGEDFRFGRGREGDAGALARLGAELGFTVVAVPLVGDGQPVSSSRVRELLAAGDAAAAAGLLGRPFELGGRVVPGEGRGAAIGVPTANLDVPPDLVVPGRGVYAVLARHGGAWRRGVANVGVRPTFGGDETEVVEVHLLDDQTDLYGQELVLRFIARLRDERRFDSVDDLAAQIRRDIVAAGEELAAHTP